MPGELDRQIVNRLNGALKGALNSSEVREKFQAQAMEAFIATPEEAGKFIAAEAGRLSRVIKARGITAN